jgi:hypothetical protein
MKTKLPPMKVELNESAKKASLQMAFRVEWPVKDEDAAARAWKLVGDVMQVLLPDPKDRAAIVKRFERAARAALKKQPAKAGGAR